VNGHATDLGRDIGSGIEGGYPQSTFPEMPAGAATCADLGLQEVVEPAPKPAWRPSANMDALRETARVIVSCALDVFLVNGKPIRACTGRECREYAAHHHNRARFAEWCANGLQDDMVVGSHKLDSEANVFYQEQLGFKLPPSTRH
jgi:hypothetical protein